MNETNEREIEISNVIAMSIGEAFRGLGKINILIAGKTGVGKSTLINSVFRGDLAKTGTGKPITQGIEEITRPGHPLTILDSKGLELEDYEEILDDLRKNINDRKASGDENKHIHVAWLCILESGSRIEEAEKNLVAMLDNCHIPTVVVLTRAKSQKNKSELLRYAENEFNGKVAGVLPVRSISEFIEFDDETKELKPFGLDNLISLTRNLLPEAQKRAYANALSNRNKAALQVKVDQANLEVNIAAGLAATVAAAPIPFSDAFALVPIQIGMIAKIGVTFGMELTTASVTTLVTSTIGSSAATLIGRTLVGGILKMIPGVGSVTGGAISAAIATSITKTLGNSYISVLSDFCEKYPNREIDLKMISDALKEKYNSFSF